MRILFWNKSYLPGIGGVEAFTARLAAGLLGRGHEIGVMAQRRPGEADADVVNGVRVRRFDFEAALQGEETPARLRRIQAVCDAVATEKRAFAPDIVHVNFDDASPYFHLRTRGAHASPTVVAFQTALTRPARETDALAGALIAHAARLVAASRFGADNIATQANVRRADIAIIPPGAPPEDFVPAISRADDPVIAFMGRLAPEKGCDLAIEALALLPAPTRLIVIGDGPERARLEALAAARGVGARVRFAGHVDAAERRRLLSQARALVAPSRQAELFGVVAVEGAMMRLPVIASAAGGLPEIIEPDRTGFLVETGDFAAIARHLAKLIAAPDLARRMGEAARRRALGLYTRDATTDAYEWLYRDAVRAFADVEAAM